MRLYTQLTRISCAKLLAIFISISHSYLFWRAQSYILLFYVYHWVEYHDNGESVCWEWCWLPNLFGLKFSCLPLQSYSFFFIITSHIRFNGYYTCILSSSQIEIFYPLDCKLLYEVFLRPTLLKNSPSGFNEVSGEGTANNGFQYFQFELHISIRFLNFW